MAKKLTQRSIDAIEPQGAANVFVFDGALPGFGLRVTPNGVKSFFVQYRAGRGRGAPKRRLTIGRYGKLTVEQARREARRLLGEVAQGRDPASERAQERKLGTVAALAEHWLDEHVRTKRKTNTVRSYRSILGAHLLPALGTRRINAVTRADLARLHHSLNDSPFQANRVLAIAGAMFAWAGRHGLVPEGCNPARGIERYREGRRERFLSDAELARLGSALSDGEAKGMNPAAVAAVRLLLLTGMRRGEVLGLRWSDIAADGASLRLREAKAGPRTVPLNAPARALLASLPRLAGNPYVFPGTKAGAPLVDLKKPWRWLAGRAELEGVRLHDLRHTHASVAASGGVSLLMIGKLLGHHQPQTTARYSHLAPDPVAAASEVVGGRIAAAMRGEGGGDVVPMHKPGRRR